MWPPTFFSPPPSPAGTLAAASPSSRPHVAKARYLLLGILIHAFLHFGNASGNWYVLLGGKEPVYQSVLCRVQHLLMANGISGDNIVTISEGEVKSYKTYPDQPLPAHDCKTDYTNVTRKSFFQVRFSLFLLRDGFFQCRGLLFHGTTQDGLLCTCQLVVRVLYLGGGEVSHHPKAILVLRLSCVLCLLCVVQSFPVWTFWVLGHPR